MKNTLRQKLFLSIQEAQVKLSQLTPVQKSTIEKKWDIEHAYYSSVMEGSKLDRQEFEKLAEKVA
jgi:hypothetical protein